MGDDYQVLFTSSKKNRLYIKKVAKRINQKITLIGSVVNQSNKTKVIFNNKEIKSLNYKGYSHKF